MEPKFRKTAIAAAVAASVGVQPGVVAAVGLADGIYDMVINNTPYLVGTGYDIGGDGAWNSSFTFGCLPGTKGCASNAMYDDTIALPVNGRYAGNVANGLQGMVRISVVGGVITGLGAFEFDTILATAGGDFVQYGSCSGFTGTVDGAGNISLTPTGTLATVGDFASLVDEAWNIDDFNGGTGTGTNFVPNPPNSNTAHDSFTTGTATNGSGSINGAVYDGSTAVLVKAGSVGSAWGGFFGAQYFEVWNVSFNYTGCVPGSGLSAACLPPIPIPPAVWLFASGLAGLVRLARRRKPVPG